MHSSTQTTDDLKGRSAGKESFFHTNECRLFIQGRGGGANASLDKIIQANIANPSRLWLLVFDSRTYGRKYAKYALKSDCQQTKAIVINGLIGNGKIFLPSREKIKCSATRKGTVGKCGIAFGKSSHLMQQILCIFRPFQNFEIEFYGTTETNQSEKKMHFCWYTYIIEKMIFVPKFIGLLASGIFLLIKEVIRAFLMSSSFRNPGVFFSVKPRENIPLNQKCKENVYSHS